jgi:hypothetical protein
VELLHLLTAALGTKRTFRDVRYPVAIGGKADDICSLRDFPVLTRFRHPPTYFAVTHNDVFALLMW